MTRASRSTRELLTEAEVHLQLAQSYASGPVDEQVVVDAICMRLSAGIAAHDAGVHRHENIVRAGALVEESVPRGRLRHR